MVDEDQYKSFIEIIQKIIDIIDATLVKSVDFDAYHLNPKGSFFYFVRTMKGGNIDDARPQH